MVIVPHNIGHWAFKLSASSTLWHFSKENSIQKGILAPRQPHLVTASDTLRRTCAAFCQAFLPPAKRFPSLPLETRTLSPITHYWTAAFVELRKVAERQSSLHHALSNLFVFSSSTFVINPERFNPHLKYSGWIIHIISPLNLDLCKPALKTEQGGRRI